VAMFRMTLIEPPDWAIQPDLSITAVTVADYAAIQQRRDRMPAAVHQEVEAYLNDPRLYVVGDQDQDSFPNRDRMTWEYYIGSESYIAHTDPGWFQISIQCRCLKHPWGPVKRPSDYLGLEVWLKCVSGRWAFSVFRNTDSSSI
jgi:hypothetical protein